MPVFDYKCPVCSRGREVFLKPADVNSSVYCRCGSAMNKQISTPYVRGDYAPYECPVTGKMIEGRRAHEENLKRTGCRVLEPGESAGYSRAVERENERFDQMIEQTAEELIAALPSEKKERLAAEMDAGLTAEIVRDTPQF